MTQRPELDGYAVMASVPNWLATLFETDRAESANCFTVCQTEGEEQYIAILVLQRGTSQLRCVMPMSDPTVRHYLHDAIAQQQLRLWLNVENTSQVVMFSINQTLRNPSRLQALLELAAPTETDIRTLADVMADQAIPGYAPTLIEGRCVTDVIAVLVGDGLREQIAEALQVGAER